LTCDARKPLDERLAILACALVSRSQVRRKRFIDGIVYLSNRKNPPSNETFVPPLAGPIGFDRGREMIFNLPELRYGSIPATFAAPA
jgi:hypothetical protein